MLSIVPSKGIVNRLSTPRLVIKFLELTSFTNENELSTVYSFSIKSFKNNNEKFK